ncbi:hypothetical protein AMTR_s00098p00171290 [Amborella trichopoda]|uniref:Uncharacterized protein n=1 Tax=Amborella trichopoda TaxID=13333 RepID=W1NX00_AMBTC|nr:hypothetical protein AMTR_s00098p00171290 [Amborella trichopoda]
MVDPLAIVVIDQDIEPLQVFNQKMQYPLEVEADGPIDPLSVLVEGKVGELISSVAQLSQQSLITYFAMYASENSREMDHYESRANVEVGDSSNREKGPIDIDEEYVDNGIVPVMFEDMGADFNVPIGVVLEEMKAKKKEEKLQKTKVDAKLKKKKEVESTPAKKMETSKETIGFVKPSQSSARLAARFRGGETYPSQALRMSELELVCLSSEQWAFESICDIKNAAL